MEPIGTTGLGPFGIGGVQGHHLDECPTALVVAHLPKPARMDGVSTVDPLLDARARVLSDLTAAGLADAPTVSLVEDCLARRRWWLAQWQQGAAYVDGLLAQDVQDALFDNSRRWPVCIGCANPVEHSLTIEPELGPDPHWVCSESGTLVAALGALASAAPPAVS